MVMARKGLRLDDGALVCGVMGMVGDLGTVGDFDIGASDGVWGDGGHSCWEVYVYAPIFSGWARFQEFKIQSHSPFPDRRFGSTLARFLKFKVSRTEFLTARLRKFNNFPNQQCCQQLARHGTTHCISCSRLEHWYAT